MWLQSITLVVIFSTTSLRAWVCLPSTKYPVAHANIHASSWTSRSRHCLSTTVSSSQDLLVTNKSTAHTPVHTPVFIEFEGAHEIVVSIAKDSKDKDKEKEDKSSHSSSSSGKEKKEHKMMSTASAMTKKFFLPKALENSSPGDN